jgi:NADH dehydrogenase
VGLFVRDVVLTRDEVRGLMENTLVTDSPPVGTTKLSAWARENAAWLGSRYHSELARHFLPV